ncbi:MAG: glycosyltransferase [Verrucomicrobiota bacterium]
MTIDTECDKSANWRTSDPLRFTGVTHAIPNRLQPLFGRAGVRPTYLLSPEVMTDPKSCEVLRSLSDVELTTHLHGEFMTPQIKTWNFAGTTTHDMQWEYPPELEQAKLAALTELFQQQIGRTPTSFRAGRFGISPHTGRWLRELGYLVDSSVTPHICWNSWVGEKRPDFRNFPERPYTVAPDGNIWTPGKSDFLEVPVTILPAGTVPANKAPDPIWFRPWYSDGETLCNVLRYVVGEKAADGLCRPLVMMFHNVELIAGASPYPRTEAEVERYLQMLERVFDLAVKLGIKFCTLTEYYRHHMAGLASNRATATSDSASPQTISASTSLCAPEVNLPVALVDAALDRHGVEPWFKYAFRERASRWDCWRPCEWIARHFPKGAPVLSLGTGVGYNLFWLAQHGFSELHGLDVNASAIAAGQDIAREAGLPVRLWVDDALKPARLPAKKFAVIEALIWVCAQDKFPLEGLLDRYMPHLASDGVFIVDIIDATYNLSPLNQYHTADWGKPVAQRRPSEYKHRFSEAQVRQIFEAKGMTLTAVMRESTGTPKAVYVASQQVAVAHPVHRAPVSRKPRVLLLADMPNWIFERHAKTLHLFLRDEFEFTMGFRGENYDEDNFDLIYPLEFHVVDAERIRDPRKYVTGIRSHAAWQLVDFFRTFKTTWQHQDLQPFAQKLARYFQGVHVVSRRLEKIFQPVLPSVEWLSHGVDTEFFTPATSTDQSGARLRLGWAGNRAWSNKGFREIIEPLGRLPGVELVFCGYVDRNLSLEEMRAFYNSLDCYVCASEYEGNNNSLMEAAAMKRAIITTDNGAVPEYLRHGRSALIVRRALPDFIQAATQLRDDPALRVRLGSAARESVKSTFDWKLMAVCHRDFFLRTMKSHDSFQPSIQSGLGAVTHNLSQRNLDQPAQTKPYDESTRQSAKGIPASYAATKTAEVERPAASAAPAAVSPGVQPGATLSVRARKEPRLFPALPSGGVQKNPGRLRVCIASPEFVGLFQNGGIGTAYSTMAEALVEAGHHVTCLYLGGKTVASHNIDYWVNDFKRRGMALVFLPETKDPRLDNSECVIKAYEVYHWLKKNDHFDVIHFPEWHGSGYYAIAAKRQGLAFARTTFCVGLHSGTDWLKMANDGYLADMGELEQDFMERQSVAMSDTVFSPSQYLINWVVERGWEVPAASYVQQNILPHSARSEKKLVSEQLQDINALVFFGRLETRKGVALFCDALDRIDDSAARKIQGVVFMGKEGSVNGVRARLYITNRSKRWPWKTQIISNRDQPQAMEFIGRKGQLAVIPSLVENSPYTICECLGLGISFVASRVGGIPELIAPDDAVRVCFNAAPEELAAKLSAALTQGFRAAQPSMDACANEQSWIAWHENLVLEPGRESGALPAHPQNLPKVSVCLATCNQPAFLRQSLALLHALDYSNYEVVLVDAGSTQPAAIQALQELEPAFAQRGWKIVRQKERCPGAARNTAVRNATGDFVLFMDDDNFADPAGLSTLVKAAVHSNADIVTCGMNCFSGTEAPNTQAASKSRWLPLGAAAAVGAFCNCFGGANALVRRSCFERSGGFTESDGVTHEDWEFYAKAVLQGFKLTVVPEFLFWHRESADSTARTASGYQNAMLSIQPYLDAVPEALRNFVLFAQGQHVWLNRLPGRGSFGSVEINVCVAWRSKLEAAKIFIRQKQTKAAICLLDEAVKSLEGCQHPLIILEALLCVGEEMRALESGRAVKLLKLGLDLAKSIRHQAAEQTATKLLASLSSAPALAAPPAVLEPAIPKSEPPLVSVVIPCYKQAHFLPEAVESVVEQTFSDWEILIVNDGSPDNTSAVANQLIAKHPGKQIRLIEKSNGGLPGARNAGIRAARGKYLLPLDADDKIKPTLLAKLVPILDNRPKVGFAYTHIQHFGEIDTEFPLPDFDRATLITKDNIACVCALVRRSAWEQAGGYNEAMRPQGYEDWDLWIGCAEHGWEGYCLHEPLFLYRKSGGSMLSNANQQRERLIAQIVLNHPKLYNEATRKSAEELLDRHAGAKAAAPATASSVGHSDKPRLRITYLISSILGVTGGNQTLLRQAEEMHRRGHNVTIVTHTARPDWFQFQTRVIQAPAGQPLAASVPTSDIVVATYFTNAHELATIKAPVKIYYAQGDQFVFADATMADTPQNRRWRELSRASYLLPGIRFVPNSRNLADAVQKLCGRHHDAILPVCTDQTIFRPLQRSLPGSRFRLLIVGPDSRGTEAEPLLFKGIQDIHDGLQILARKNPHFTAVRMSATGPDIFSHFPCEFYIAPGDEMKTALFGTSHILIYASHYDSCPRPPQEGMAAGCAVVCTATSGAMEYCRDGENALLVPIKSPQAIAEAVERLIGDHALREKLVEGGLATAREYPREREWNEWEALLFRFLDEAAKAPAAAAAIPKPAKAAMPIILPPCSLVGYLGEARGLLKVKNFKAAWNSGCAALQARPFHPEACLFLGEVARAAGDFDAARRCGQYAASLAPRWKPAQQFLKANSRGNGKPGRFVLPPTITGKAGKAPRLTVCLIAKNEEQFLERCLQSVRDIAGQIVVVDTGSTDGTVEIAKRFNAETHFFAWNDDFSAARNEALKYVTGDWVLCLDADEELSPEHRQTILEEMQAPGVMGYRLPIIDQGLEDEGCSYVPRLFRNAPGLFYVGRVHEQIFSSLEVRAREWGLENRLGRTALLHQGYKKEVVDSRHKSERNLRLLRLALEEMPGEPNLVMNLGLELARSGQVEAGLEQYREALRLMSALPPRQVAPELRETLLTQLTTHLLGAGWFSEIVELWQQPFAQSAGLTASQHFMLGLARMELKQPDAAAEQMRQCLAKRGQPALSPIHKEIRKAGPRHCLALSLAALGDKVEADKAFREALTEDPQSRPVRFDFAKFHFQQGRPLEALKLLNELVAGNGRDVQAWLLGGQIALSQPEFLEFAQDWTGEAMKHLPDDSGILLQRAEVLTLHQQVALALPVWTRAHYPNSARHLAALTLCEVLAGECRRRFTPQNERLVSQEFLGWYRQLLKCKAHSVMKQIGEKLEDLGVVLPAAAQALAAAMKKAEAAMAV